MKTILGLSLLTATMLFADTPAADPAKLLYDTGIRQTQEGKFEAARLVLQTLVHTYPKDPLALQAKWAIDATLLFEEGQARTKGGRYETARLAFETLIAVYPENPLVERAKSAIEAIEQKEKKSGRVVKAMEFRDVQAVPVSEIRAAMEEREVRLCVGKMYRSQDIEQAKTALEEILAEKGVANVRIQTQTRTVRPDAVDVIFIVEKPRGSLLGSPWRLAMAGWHRVHPAAVDAQDSGL
jgi:outer membrane protein assembly factor BamD (BamD/ComL family)